MRLLIVLFAVLYGVAFAADLKPADIDAMQSRVAKMKDYPLCEELGRVVRKADGSPRALKWEELVRARVVGNGWMSEKEVAFARSREPTIGMGMCGAVAAFGRPERINNSTSAAGTLSQWVYDRGRVRYLHFMNGALASFDS